MKMYVSKCCCCCSLKYGLYTFLVIAFLFRIAAAATFWFTPSSLLGSRHLDVLNEIGVVCGFMFGWCVATSGVLFFALKGIVEKRSMYIYPYVVVLIVELLVMLSLTIYLCVKESLWNLFDLFIGGGINIYCIICLISLYKVVKDAEKSRPAIETVTFKTV